MEQHKKFQKISNETRLGKDNGKQQFFLWNVAELPAGKQRLAGIKITLFKLLLSILLRYLKCQGTTGQSTNRSS